MTATGTVGERVRRVLAGYIARPDVDLSDDRVLNRDLGIDSLDIVEVTMRLEDEFAIPFQDDPTLSDVRTVGDLVRFMEKKHGSDQ